MSSIFRATHGVALGVCMGATLLILMMSGPARLLASALPVASPDTPGISHGEQEGPIVTLTVHAMVPEKIKVSDSAQRTVRATVLAVATPISQVKLQTHEGQRLVLYLEPAVCDALQVGQQILLYVGQRSVRDVLTERSLAGVPVPGEVCDYCL